MSTTAAPEPKPPSTTIRHQTDQSSDGRGLDSSLQGKRKQQTREGNSATERTHLRDVSNRDATSESLTQETKIEKPTHELSEQSLLDLLSRPDENRFHDVWDLYCRLDRTKQESMRPLLVVYLSKSRGIVETGRAISLFRQIPLDQWNDELLAAGVLVLMRSGDLESAIDRFKAGLNLRGLSGGLEYILADTIAHQRWPALIGVWLDFHASRSKPESGSSFDQLGLERLETLPGLDKLFFAFERYLVTDGARSLRAINLYTTSKHGLGALRRKFASLALGQPCSPKQAIAILSMFDDSQLYHDYLLRMLTRVNDKLETKSSTIWLLDIYKTYRKMPDSQPSSSLLRGMFNLCYAIDTAGLEQLYHDWCKTRGDLDQWGFEKFLKFYASTGDVPAVQQLWKRYVSKYPRVLKSPRAFRSTMNVYAQVGNIALAERELHAMTDQYRVKPDLDTWNTLLKCYMRADAYDKVLSCFEQISKLHRPDSYTYAHVMAMSAKKGDLETTLDFFTRSQHDQVPVSKEIAMSLVMAYCRNDRLLEAEKICVELAERKATSAAIWNQLIYFNGMQGKLAKCHELLQAMRKFNVGWDRQTHEFLLQALVGVDQIQPAYRLLQSACQDKLFPVGPEHFTIVMAGAARTGEFALVDTLSSQLRRTGQPMTFNAQVALLEAALNRTPSAHRTRVLCRELVDIMRSMLPVDKTGFENVGTGNSVSTTPGDLRSLRKQTKGIGRALSLLVESRDFTTAEELVNIYIKVFPKLSEGEPFPPEVASALMLGYLKDRKYTQIHELWDQTWQHVLARAGRGKGVAIYPAHQYDLSRPLGIVVKTFREQNDGKGLLECIDRVTAAGFKLTRSNWNLAIRYLAEMGQWEPAMHWCEMMLMPRWRGWSPSKRSLQERRHLTNTRVLQASKVAVLSLQQEWLKLRKLAAWSAEVSAKLMNIERRCPKLHHAFVTTDYDHLPTTKMSSKKASLTKGVNGLLKNMSHAELRTMKKALERQSRLGRKRRSRRVTVTSIKRAKAKPMMPMGTKTASLQLRNPHAALRRRLHESLTSDDPLTNVPMSSDGGLDASRVQGEPHSSRQP